MLKAEQNKHYICAEMQCACRSSIEKN